MDSLYLLILGLVLLVVGLFYLYVNVYRDNSAQGAVSEVSPVLMLFFGFLGWKKHKYPMAVIFVGLILVGVVIV